MGVGVQDFFGLGFSGLGLGFWHAYACFVVSWAWGVCSVDRLSVA